MKYGSKGTVNAMNKLAMPLVDSHFHVFEGGKAIASARYRPTYEASLEDWHGMVGQFGDPYGVVVQTSFLGTDNSALLAALRARPTRLRGIAVVTPDVADAVLDDMQAAGVKGIRLNLYRDADWRRIGRAPWRALFARLAQRNWHVELHTDSGECHAILAELDNALGDLPVPVVLDHFGRPGAAGTADPVFETAAAVRGRRPLWVKMSAPYRLHTGLRWQALARKWGEVAGQDRLVWGSDWPWTNHEASGRAQECRAMSQWSLSPVTGEAPLGVSTQALRWRNAAALYGFEIEAVSVPGGDPVASVPT